MSEEVKLDKDRQREAKKYARIERRLSLVDMLFAAVYAIAWLAFGWSTTLQAYLLNLTTNPWLITAGFSVVIGGIFYWINLPLVYYSGYVLPHRFGISNQTKKSWIIDQLKGLLVGGLIGLLFLEIIYAVLRLYPTTWWLWAAVILLVFNVLLANLAPILLFPIFYKFKPLDEEYALLKARLLALADRAKTKVVGIYQFDMSSRSKAANAALTGLGNTRRIILGDTLLNEFSEDEIETILAHELGHHVHKDIPYGILIESILTMVGLYFASRGLAWGVEKFGFSGPADIAALPLLGLVIGAYNLITMPLNNAYSRWRERRADQFALEITHNGTAYAAALTRLANQNLADVDPEGWVEWLLYSHPALKKRILMAQEFQGN